MYTKTLSDAWWSVLSLYWWNVLAINWNPMTCFLPSRRSFDFTPALNFNSESNKKWRLNLLHFKECVIMNHTLSDRLSLLCSVLFTLTSLHSNASMVTALKQGEWPLTWMIIGCWLFSPFAAVNVNLVVTIKHEMEELYESCKSLWAWCGNRAKTHTAVDHKMLDIFWPSLDVWLYFNHSFLWPFFLALKYPNGVSTHVCAYFQMSYFF